MQAGRNNYRRRRGLSPEQKELAARCSYSVILVVVALFLLRPLMVSQMLSRAEAYAAVGLFDESKRQCNKALLFDSDNSQAWCQLGHVYKAQGDLGLALMAYQRATEADPANKPADYELATLYLRDRCYEQAIPLLEQVRLLGPDHNKRLQQDGFSYHKSALSLLITCYEKVGEPAKAQFAEKEMRLFYPDSASSGPSPAAIVWPHED